MPQTEPKLKSDLGHEPFLMKNAEKSSGTSRS